MKIQSCIVCLCIGCMLLQGSSLPENASGNSIPLINAYAHNDYWHKRPLLDALENGYTNIETDIFHVGDEFVVAHLFPFFRQGKTLETLYLKPLYDHIARNKGRVYSDYNQPVVLMIDIKINGNNTYRAMKKLLEKYRSILTSYENGKITERQVTVILSGSKPIDSVRSENKRLVFIDEDLKTISKSNNPSSVCPLASCHYSSLLSWDGYGSMPAKEKTKLVLFVKMAHSQGKKVRLWASPEKEEVWRELLACGVDLINTDDLVSLRKFLLSYRMENDALAVHVTK